MSQDIPDSRTLDVWVRLFSFWWVRWSSGAVIIAVGVDEEVSEEFSGGGVDDQDLEVLDEQDDVGSGVGSSDADVA